MAVRLVFCGLALGVGLSGCAGLNAESPAEAKQKVVAERAEARWELLIKGDVAGAYQYLSAGSKVTTSLDVYKAKIKPGIWRKAKVNKIECEGELCKVQMLITYDFEKGYARVKGLETPVQETWIIENGSAWLIYG